VPCRWGEDDLEELFQANTQFLNKCGICWVITYLTFMLVLIKRVSHGLTYARLILLNLIDAECARTQKFLQRLLELDPEKRISAKEALKIL
jgi:hypothetical protein